MSRSESKGESKGKKALECATQIVTKLSIVFYRVLEGIWCRWNWEEGKEVCGNCEAGCNY